LESLAYGMGSGISASGPVVPTLRIAPPFVPAPAIASNALSHPIGVLQQQQPATNAVLLPHVPSAPAVPASQAAPKQTSNVNATAQSAPLKAASVDQSSSLRDSYLKALEQHGLPRSDANGTGTQEQAQVATVVKAVPSSAQRQSAGPAPLPWRPTEPFGNAPIYVAARPEPKQAPLPAPANLSFSVPFVGSSDAPDFLSGFDKVAVGMAAIDPLHNSNSSASQPHKVEGASAFQHSPPFTSRSFDDFHQFLGKDIGPADTKVATSTAAAIDADSYALFAAESAAAAASQHAAYLPNINNHAGFMTGIPTTDLIKNRTESFDVKGTIQMVAEHVGGFAPRSPQTKTATHGNDLTRNSARHHLDAASSAHRNGFENYSKSEGIRQVNLGVPYNLSTGLTDAKLILDRLHGAMNAAAVSGSEPSNSATESESALHSGCASDNMSSNESDDGNSDNTASESSGSEAEGPARKKQRTRDSPDVACGASF